MPAAGDKFDLYREALVVEHDALWSEEAARLVPDPTVRAQIEQRLHSEYGRSESVSALGEMTTHVDRVVDKLQEEVMRARMVPIAQLFSKFPRIVRDVARISGKEVNFIIEDEAKGERKPAEGESKRKPAPVACVCAGRSSPLRPW
mgnify:CR=1 FL=1